MIRLQLKGASEIRTYKLPLSSDSPTKQPLTLDRVYALAKQHLDQYHRTIKSTNIVLSYTDPNSGQETVLRFPEQVADAIRAVSDTPSLLSIVIKRSGSGAWHVSPGRWKKGQIVGSGSTGNVYVGTSLDGANVFAVKELMLNPETSAVCVQRMKAEMDMIMRLPPHLNIVQYYGMERTTCALHVFMEYVAGGSIRTLLNRLGRPLHESVIRDYTKQMLQGLEFLHASNIIHGDIKGGNCLVDVDGVLKLADFGSSSKADTEWIGIRGTSLWMSPECVKGAALTTKTDIWSMACTVIEMATGRPPWHELNFTNDWAAMYYLSQAERGPTIPIHLTTTAHEFLNLCLKIDSTSRPTAAELLAHPFVTTPATDAADVSNYVHSTQAPPTWQESSLASSNANMSCFVLDPEQESLHTHRDVAPSTMNLPSITAKRVDPGSPPDSSEARSDVVSRMLRSSKVDIGKDSVRTRLGNGLSNLTEPVLFTILLYLPPRALCTLSQLNRDIANVVNAPSTGEVLWKRLFLLAFGEVDNVRCALRKGWKTYYADSMHFRDVRPAEGLTFKRRLTHARNVFEGRNELRQRVVLVVEPSKHNRQQTASRGKTPQRRANSNNGGGGNRSPQKSSFGGTFAGTGTMVGSPLKSPSLPNLSAKMSSPADVTKAQRIRKQQLDNMMNVTGGGGNGMLSAYRPFQQGGLSDMYEPITIIAPGTTPNLANYHRVIQHLESTGMSGVVKPIAFVESVPCYPIPHNVLALPYLGTSLNELLLVCGNHFTQRTVCLIALQCIEILADLHKRELLHYCITPSHIVVTESGHVNLINFKHARSYSVHTTTMPPARRPSTGASYRHKEYTYFMSAYAQKGLTPGPRDDAIALGHVLCYLLQGGLPWISDPPLSDQELYMSKKAYVAQIQRNPPVQLYHFLKHCNDLKQGEMPDYAFLKNMFLRLLTENKWSMDGVFDWTSHVGVR